MKHLPCLPYIYSSAPIYLRHICKEQICSNLLFVPCKRIRTVTFFRGRRRYNNPPKADSKKNQDKTRLLISPLKIVHTFFILPKQSCRSWITSEPFKLWPPNLATFPKIYLETLAWRVGRHKCCHGNRVLTVFFSIKRPYFNFYLLQYFITHNLAIFYQCNPGFLVTNFRKNMNLRWPIWVQVSTVIISLRISWLADFFLLPKHYFLSWLPRFIRVLSKIEVIWVIASGGSKVADGYSSFFDNKWRREGFFESSNKLNSMTW